MVTSKFSGSRLWEKTSAEACAASKNKSPTMTPGDFMLMNSSMITWLLLMTGDDASNTRARRATRRGQAGGEAARYSERHPNP
jgi:hypothetical protein